MYKDGPHTERINIFLMTADPEHRYSKEAERANLVSMAYFIALTFSLPYMTKISVVIRQ